MDIAFVTKAASGLKAVNVATTDPQGAATVFLNTFANVSKKEKVQVQVRVCKDGKYTVILVEPGATLKKDENCDDRPAGFIPWGSGVRVTLNTATATLTVSGGGGWLQNPLTYVVAGALTVGTIVGVSSGGGSNNTTGGGGMTPGNANTQPPPAGITATGDYGASVSVKMDQSGHNPFVGGMRVNLIHAAQSATISFTGATPWVMTTGNFDNTTGRFTTTGRGIVAGFQNVGVRFDGTISSSGAIMADWELGTGGELPTGKSIIYMVQGQKK